jgi:hypothetical protein
VLAVGLVLSIAGAALTGCDQDTGTTKTGSEMNVRPIDKVLESHTAELMGIPGVVGVYQGALEDGTPCITVMVVASTPELEARLPKKLEGHPVVIEAGGEIRPLDGAKRP